MSSASSCFDFLLSRFCRINAKLLVLLKSNKGSFRLKSGPLPSRRNLEVSQNRGGTSLGLPIRVYIGVPYIWETTI